MKSILEYVNQYFRDNRGRMVYYVSKEKKAYLVSEKDRVTVSLLHQRISISIVVGMVLFVYKIHPAFCVAAALVVLAILDVLLKKVFLPKYTLLPKYDVESNVEKKINPQEYKKQYWIGWVRIILAILFMVISYIAKDQQEPIQTVLLIIIGFVFLISGVRNQILLIKRHKNN